MQRFENTLPRNRSFIQDLSIGKKNSSKRLQTKPWLRWLIRTKEQTATTFQIPRNKPSRQLQLNEIRKWNRGTESFKRDEIIKKAASKGKMNWRKRINRRTSANNLLDKGCWIFHGRLNRYRPQGGRPY